jgi:hypothetical protein
MVVTILCQWRWIIARPSGPKTRCGGRWTEAEYTSFVKNNLRSGTRKWAPMQDCLRRARVDRGLYRCECCGETVPATIAKDDSPRSKRKKNIIVDHVRPVIDPEVGFSTWDSFIEGLFCEADNLQALCLSCHTIKTNEERAIAKSRRAKEKEEE